MGTRPENVWKDVKVVFSVYSHRNAHSSVVGVVNDIIIIIILILMSVTIQFYVSNDP